MRKSINESGADAIELASRRRRGGHDSADAPQRFGLCTGARIERRLDVAHGLGPGAHDRRAQRVAHERADGLPPGALLRLVFLGNFRLHRLDHALGSLDGALLTHDLCANQPVSRRTRI